MRWIVFGGVKYRTGTRMATMTETRIHAGIPLAPPPKMIFELCLMAVEKNVMRLSEVTCANDGEYYDASVSTE